MLTLLNTLPRARKFAVAILLSGAAISFGVTGQLVAKADPVTVQAVRFDSASDLNSSTDRQIGVAVATFINGMAVGDAKSVWRFASEEDQAAFETEDAVYSAFAETFPVLTQTKDVKLETIRAEGDTPFASLVLKDASGNAYRATIGFWLDDAGDWKVISCDITPASDRLS